MSQGFTQVTSEYKEDDPHASGDVGVQVLAVRNDAGAALAGTDGDYIPITTDSSGAVRVTGGTSITQYAEDAAHVSGNSGIMSLCVRNDARGSLSGTDGDYSPVQVNASGDVRVDGSAVTQPVSGTFFQATQPVSAAALPLPSGASTSAKQDTGNTSVASIDTKTVTYTEDAAAASDPVGAAQILVRKDTPADEVSADGDNIAQRGSKYGASYVTLISSAGTIVSSLGGTQYAEDAAHASGDLGFMSLGVRKDAAAQTAGTDGDYCPPIFDASGRQHVNVGTSVLPTGAATEATLANVDTYLENLSSTVHGEDNPSQNNDSGIPALVIRKDTPVESTSADGDYSILQMSAGRLWCSSIITAGATSIGKAEDVASADADVGVPSMAVRKATPANTSGTDGDYEFFQMSAGRLWVSAIIDAALPTGTNSIGDFRSITTSLTPGTSAAHLGKAEDAAHADGDTGVMSLAVRKNTAISTSGSDGDYQPLITNTTGHLWVDASGQTLTVGSHAVTAISGGFADGAVTTLGAKADAKSTATDTTAVTLMQVTKQVSSSVQSLDSHLPAQGQALAAASVPVVLTAIQVAALTQPVNTQTTGLVSAARTVTTSAPSITNTSWKKIIVFLNITAVPAVPATGGLQLYFYMTDNLGNSGLITVAPAAVITATGLYTFMIGEGASNAIAAPVQAVVKQITAIPIGKSLSLTVAAFDAQSYTYSLCYDLLL